MDPSDIFAVIQIPGSREFDVSFRSAEKLALFLRVYEEKREQEDCWENFVVLGRSKSSLKTLFILFRNETVDVEDIVTWLKRHCDVLAVPVKVTDSLLMGHEKKLGGERVQQLGSHRKQL
uniref:Uncharacterized protein n=1 Tax=Mustela putorius furo TaxID=9669 RepID=M3Z2J9_MUSPF